MIRKIRNINIGNQLILAFAAMVVFIIILGALFGMQSREMYEQTQIMYNHPLQVRRALSNLKVDILEIQMAMKEILIDSESYNQHINRQIIEASKNDAQKQFDLLNVYYLGPKEDVDLAYENYTNWLVTYEGNLLLMEDPNDIAGNNTLLNNGTSSVYKNQLNVYLSTMDAYARNKADELHDSSLMLSETVVIQLIVTIGIVIFLVMMISLVITANIRQPLKSLMIAAKAFTGGNMDSRVFYEKENEFGELTKAINELMGNIKDNAIIEEKREILSRTMLSIDDADAFFLETLLLLMNITDAQVGAVYLLEENKKRYKSFTSVGLEAKGEVYFDAKSFEGEFGYVLARGKLQHIQDIPENTRFVYKTICGNVIPREMIIQPIINAGEIVAIIVLGSIKPVHKSASTLIYSMQDTINARTEGILSHRKIMAFSESLSNQNRELDIQRQELSAQTKALQQQNLELEVQKDKLNEANMLKTNFLSNMSHELRTPLNSVIALAGVLKRRLNTTIPEKEHSYIEVIERNGKTLLNLINDILDISRIEAGKEELEITQFRLEDIVGDITTMMKPLANERSIELIRPSALQEVMTTDENKVRHILQNLLSNAVKFTEKGSVRIEVVEPNNGTIEVKVIDTGIGIMKDQMEHIFDEFRQADGSTSRKYGGTGLGLAIARKYANLLDGDIVIESVYGKGSTFTLSLPKTHNQDNYISGSSLPRRMRYEATESKAYSQKHEGSKTILIVEDSEPAVIQMEELLREFGYRVTVARNGREALDRIALSKPDALILDLMMPEVDGFDVIESLDSSEETSDIPVLVLTAKQITKEDEVFLGAHDVYYLIQKGDVNMSELRQMIGVMLFGREEPTRDSSRIGQLDEGIERPGILVVEDNPDNMITVKALLESRYEVYEAEDGIQGVEKAKAMVPDLVLMDIALPGIDGIEAFRQIRQDPLLQHIPVIALTASALTQDRELILAHGFEAFISKPIIEKDFYEILKGVLYGK